MSKAENKSLRAERTAHISSADGYMGMSHFFQETGDHDKARQARGIGLSYSDAFRQANWGGTVPDISDTLNRTLEIHIEKLKKISSIVPDTDISI